MPPIAPPKFSSWASMASSIKLGELGWRVFALQGGMLIQPLDGDFGPITLEKVKAFQKANHLYVDGLAGPATQAAVLKDAEKHVDHKHKDLPAGVLRGFAEAEGGGLVAATNWSVAGGVDCGCVQVRVSGPPYSQSTMRMAFGPRRAFEYAATMLLDRVEDFHKRNTSLSHRRLIELATLAHNWPAAADQYVRYGHLLSPSKIATWAPNPAGGFYTYQDWSEVYPARILKYVTW